MKNIIPIMTCFNNNYAIPAGVAFYSLLENADANYDYKLYVLHTDISEDNQKLLLKTVEKFSNATLEFINMENKFEDLFKNTKTKGHYSKEMFYKFLAPSIFPQFDKIIITDVDVVFLGDVAKVFNVVSIDEDVYLAGHRSFIKKQSWLESIYDAYKKDFSMKEIESLQTNACFWVLNLKKLREDNCEQKFIDYAIQNAYRIRQPEQDVVNIICYPKVKYLPSNAVVCSYLYDLYKNKEDCAEDAVYTTEEVLNAIENPIQLHYASQEKPWKGYPLKADIWFKYLTKTEMLNQYILMLNKKFNVKRKTIFQLNLPFSKYRVKLIKERK